MHGRLAPIVRIQKDKILEATAPRARQADGEIVMGSSSRPISNSCELIFTPAETPCARANSFMVGARMSREYPGTLVLAYICFGACPVIKAAASAMAVRTKGKNSGGRARGKKSAMSRAMHP